MSEFLNSISTVRKNWKDYPQWEQEQDNKEAQRKALHKSKNFSKEELEQADKFGRTIIDAVDIMDRYSEDKVEDVETVCDPLTALSSVAVGLTTAVVGFFIVIQKLSKQGPEIKKAQAEYAPKLRELKNKYEKENKNSKITDDFSLRQNFKYFDKVNKIEDPAIKAEVKEILTQYHKKLKPVRTKSSLLILSYLGSVLAGFLGTVVLANLWSTRTQLQSARIARYQARENELKDPRNFVIYTPDQIQDAGKIAQDMPNVKKPKNQGWLSSIKSLFRDNKKFNKWKIGYDKNAKSTNIKDLNLTPEQLKKAKSDQDVLFRIIRKVNDTAEDYAESMESTGGFILGSSPVAGIILGKVISMVPGMSKVSEKITGSILSLPPIQNFIKNKHSIDKSMPPEEAQKLLKSLTDSYTRGFKGPVFVGLTTILTTVASVSIALKLQKQATRAGRFAAKQELLEDPRNFIYYDDEELKETKNVKAPAQKRGFLHRISEDIKFLPKAFKIHREYNKHKELMDGKQLKLREALNKVELEPGQLEEAENLQSKVFNTFDKVDEMTERYSENVEAGTDMIMQTAPLAFIGGFIASIIGFGALLLKSHDNPLKTLSAGLSVFNKVMTPLKSPVEKTFVSLGEGLEKGYLKYKTDNKTIEKAAKKAVEDEIEDELDKELVETVFDKVRNIKFGKTLFNIAKSPERSRKKILEVMPKMLKNTAFTFREGLQASVDKFDITPASILKFVQDNDDVGKTLFPDSDLFFESIQYLEPEMLPKSADKLIDMLQIDDYKLESLIREMYKGPEAKINIPDNFVKEILGDNFKSKSSEFGMPGLNKDNIKILDTLVTKGFKNLGEDQYKELLKIAPNFSDSKNLNNMSKKDVEKLVIRFEKAMENLPTGDMNKFLSKINELRKKDPDDFKEFMSDVTFKQLFNNTPYLRNAFMATSAIGFSATTFVLYLVTVYCSELQKRAGRIGTMKAIQDLQDPRYFADKKQVKQTHEVEAVKDNSPVNNSQVDAFKEKYILQNE